MAPRDNAARSKDCGQPHVGASFVRLLPPCPTSLLALAIKRRRLACGSKLPDRIGQTCRTGSLKQVYGLFVGLVADALFLDL